MIEPDFHDRGHARSPAGGAEIQSDKIYTAAALERRGTSRARNQGNQGQLNGDELSQKEASQKATWSDQRDNNLARGKVKLVDRQRS